jgi:hypothetical protein
MFIPWMFLCLQIFMYHLNVLVTLVFVVAQFTYLPFPNYWDFAVDHKTNIYFTPPGRQTDFEYLTLPEDSGLFLSCCILHSEILLYIRK